jgi:isopentenyl phosphate kinase
VDIIKLGGSVITDKESYKRVNLKLLRKLCKVLSETGEKKILIHGAGSFGHILAIKSSLDKPGRIKGKETAISRVISDVTELNSVLVDELNKNGVRAIPVPPHAIYDGRKHNFEIVNLLLKDGFVPLLFGDIVLSNGGYRIISGDEIALDLSRRFTPNSVIFVTDVDGLYDSDPKSSKTAKFIPSIDSKDVSIVNTGKDATGSMAGKMERIKKIVLYTDRVIILNGRRPERLLACLQDMNTKCTVIT